MGVTNYDTVNGQLIGECTNGVTTTYLTDELGSTIETAQSGAIVNQYAYSPYGITIAKSEIGADPAFLWVGAMSYKSTSRIYAEEYLKDRHLSVDLGRWATRDRTWPNESAYVYAHCNPVVFTDPSGLSPNTGTATCFSVQNTDITNEWCGKQETYTYAKGVFCNQQAGTKACPRYLEGMTGAWPNVTTSEDILLMHTCSPGTCDGPPTIARSHCKYSQTRAYQPQYSGVRCGQKVTVSKNGKSITITIIDAGPAPGLKSKAMVDLTQTAAQAFSKLLGIPWNGCSHFEVHNVQVSF